MTFISGFSFDEGSGSFGFVQTFKLSFIFELSFLIFLLILLSSGIFCDLPTVLFSTTLEAPPPNADVLLLFLPFNFSLDTVPSSESSNPIVLLAPTLIGLASFPAAIATDIGGLKSGLFSGSIRKFPLCLFLNTFLSPSDLTNSSCEFLPSKDFGFPSPDKVAGGLNVSKSKFPLFPFNSSTISNVSDSKNPGS